MIDHGADVYDLKEKLKNNSNNEIWQQYCGFLDLSMDGYMKIQRRLMEEQIQLWSNCGLGQSILKGNIPEIWMNSAKWYR